MLNFPIPLDGELSTRPPRCLGCGYILDGLEEPRCPECGREFDPANEATYSRKPAFVFWTFIFPGLCLALGGGLLLTAAFLSVGVIGVGLVIAVPFSIGGILGYAVRAQARILTILVLATLVGVVTTMLMANLAGMFCGLILAALFLIPAFVGVLFGSLLRNILKGSQFSQRWYLPIVGFLLLPPLAQFAEHCAGIVHPPETVATSMVMAVPLDRAWNSRLFQSGQSAPPLMHVGLPRPLESSVSHYPIGKISEIRLSKGTLQIRITDREEGRLLAFQYVGQNHVEDRAIKLLDTQMAFEPLGPNQTRVTIATRYQPLMTPRWYWRPFERWSGETEQKYLLDEMARDASATPQIAAAEQP